MRRFNPFQLRLLLATAAVMAVTVVASLSDISMTRCLLILMLAPAVTVVGYEVLGYRYLASALRTSE